MLSRHAIVIMYITAPASRGLPKHKLVELLVDVQNGALVDPIALGPPVLRRQSAIVPAA